MPLSETLREELAAIAPGRDCDRHAELSGLFHTAGVVHLRGRGELSLHLDVGAAAVARRAFRILRELGVESEIRTYARPAFERSTRFQLHIPGTSGARGVLHEAGVLAPRGRPLEQPPKRVIGRGCCRGAYLRGAMLGGGSLSGPRNPHLEIRTASLQGARFVAMIAGQSGTRLAVLERGRYALAYAKGVEAIVDVLTLAGATDAALALEEHSVMAVTRSSANRLANADHANLVRSSRAAYAQLEAVRRLRDSGALEQLPDSLREIAALRLRHPTLSLRELAERCAPPATKSAVHRRLRHLCELADREPVFTG